MALAAAADVQARLSDQAYRRLFAKNGGSTVDTVFLALCLAEAESELLTILAAAFPSGFESSGGTVDVVIVGWCVDLACERAAIRHLAATEGSGYFLGGERARKAARDMARDRDRRPVTAGTGPAAHIVAGGVVAADDVSGDWARAANGSDRSGF